MLTPTGRVMMLSGAYRGIGLATAKVLAGPGYRLSLGARDPGTIPVDEIGGEAIAARWDAQDAGTSAEWTAATKAHFGRIDGVVMNAGVMVPGDLEAGDEAAYDLMWEVNFKGPLRLVRAVMPSLRDAGSGRVINVVSLSGVRVLSAGNLGYSASKFAAMSLTHAIRRAGWDDGVRATSICPGLVETDMTEGVSASAGSFKIGAGTIAEAIAYALSVPNEAVVAEILLNSRLEPSF